MGYTGVAFSPFPTSLSHQLCPSRPFSTSLNEKTSEHDGPASNLQIVLDHDLPESYRKYLEATRSGRLQHRGVSLFDMLRTCDAGTHPRGASASTRAGLFFRGLSSCRFVGTFFGPGLSLVPLILLAHIMMSVIGFSVPQRAFPVDTNASCGLFAGVVFSLVGPGARGTCATAVVGYPLNMQVAVRAR